MKIIKFKESDREKLLAFKDKKQFEETIPLREFGSLRGSTIYIEENNEVHGIASLIYNELHPHVEYLYFAAETFIDIHAEPLFQQKTWHRIV